MFECLKAGRFLVEETDAVMIAVEARLKGYVRS